MNEPPHGSESPPAASSKRGDLDDEPRSFTQSPPALGNQFEDDPLLGSWIARAFPRPLAGMLAPELHELGALAGGELYRLQLADRGNEPVLTQWDAWGR